MTTWNTDPSTAHRDGTPIIGDFGDGPTMAVWYGTKDKWTVVQVDQLSNRRALFSNIWLDDEKLIRWQNMPSTEG